MPVSTIQRHLKAWQKRVLKKIGLKDEKEAAALHEKVRADVYLGVKRELDNSSPTDIRVVTCWGSGMSLKQISEVTGISISTVQRHLKAWQKRVLEKIDLHQIVNKDLEFRTGTSEMIRNAAKKFTRAA
jgi:DNA-binding NarL/FixJ family response regulator